MKNLPVYQSLDTSFVNLAAFIRYLRDRQFVGSLRLELKGYEADVVFGEGNQLSVSEHDRLAGRIAEGDEALQRLLIRAREPGGVINVYQSQQAAEENEIVEEKVAATAALADDAVKKPLLRHEFSIKVAPNNVVGNCNVKEQIKIPVSTIDVKNLSVAPLEKGNSPQPLPLEFSNRVEERAARQAQLSPEDWKQFLQLMAELLGTIDKTLGSAKLDFAGAFAKAAGEISSDYPFLNASSGAFSYANGKVVMRDAGGGGEQINAKLFAAGINEVLRRIFEKLRANPRFESVYRETSQSVLALIYRRKPLYDKYFITPQLEKLLGV